MDCLFIGLPLRQFSRNQMNESFLDLILLLNNWNLNSLTQSIIFQQIIADIKTTVMSIFKDKRSYNYILVFNFYLFYI